MMSTSKAKAKLLPFDAARYLVDDEAIAEYMTAVLETDDTDLLLLALSERCARQGHGASRQRCGAGSRESLQSAGARRKATP